MCRNIIRIVNRPPEPMIIGPSITNPAPDEVLANRGRRCGSATRCGYALMAPSHRLLLDLSAHCEPTLRMLIAAARTTIKACGVQNDLERLDPFGRVGVGTGNLRYRLPQTDARVLDPRQVQARGVLPGGFGVVVEGSIGVAAFFRNIHTLNDPVGISVRATIHHRQRRIHQLAAQIHTSTHRSLGLTISRQRPRRRELAGNVRKISRLLMCS